MKNSKIYITLMFFLFAWACNPLEDELKVAEADNSIPTADIEYTLTEDDYETADDFCDCAGFGNFGSDDDVRSAIPVVLEDVFPALGGGSSAIVTYDFFNGSSPDFRGTETVLTVSAADYTALDFGFGNFSSKVNDLVTFAEYATTPAPDGGGYADPGQDGDYMIVTYEFFDGSSTNTTTDRVVYTVSNGWVFAYELPASEYGAGGFFASESPPDFSTDDEGKEKMPAYLNANANFFKEAIFDDNLSEGDVLAVWFLYDDSDLGTTPDVGLHVWDGTEWLFYNDNFQTTAESLAFGHDGTGWVPDNTIKYTLTGTDYTAIAAAYLASNPDGSDSMSNFGNYDIQLWSSTEIFESITTRLLEIFPSTGAGQKYLVTYAVWKPGNDNFTINVIYDGSAWEQITE